jgi:hypothetical protein
MRVRALLTGRGSIAGAGLLLSIVTATALENNTSAPYCTDLKQLTQLATRTSQFAAIAGKPREGNFRDTTLPLTGWKDCALYGATTYTCDSRALRSPLEAEAALTKTADEILRCLAGAWVEIKDRSSAAYVVLHPARGSASMTLSLDENDNKEYLVRLTLFLRRP